MMLVVDLDAPFSALSFVSFIFIIIRIAIMLKFVTSTFCFLY